MRPRPISNWLLAVAALVFLMVVVGGVTRLTESGLSIVRWEPVSGTIPPLGEEAWQEEFDLYRQSPQYKQVNSGMTLSEFKNIYFWEYVHRLLGRVIGLAFALPLLWFWLRKAIPAGYGWKLVALLALGGLQGAIGWWMVASGLVDRPDVSHIRLAVHLLNALLIFASLVWVALDLRRLADDPAAKPARMPTIAIWALSALALQLLFGAYVAGLDAGYAYSSWPKMGDEWFPAATPMLDPYLRNFVDNPIMVQFVHRWLAWGVALAAALFARAAWRRGLRTEAFALLAAVGVQILLGIATLLSGVDISIAAGHQAMAVVLLGTMVATGHRLGVTDDQSGATSDRSGPSGG
ncbi:COX15/CtaA family protein [Allosphingosinicella deserti]|uniref:Heme A synthase n=1 Tax=Allosphingosinicella deserti TaxID=2116704 RepID=A0A2P7QVX2_9SPHN|nr:COX15/CtaA family protein [Sphingomonas deserti]PSJ42118.1 heme A synthase [Sphingomonas deserti]